MSTELEEMPSATKPQKEHEWLKQLVGTWRVRSEMKMGPDGPTLQGEGTEKVTSLGGLWAFAEGNAMMPDGQPMEYKFAIGYDVSFHEYRACWFASVSSHLWKYTGTLSEDGKTMTLDCTGPNMMVDGETANYRDVIEIVDENTRTLTSFGQQEDGEWMQFMKATLTRE
jgi:hypothetical protein